MSSKLLEWKEMGFKGFGDNVSKIHLMDGLNAPINGLPQDGGGRRATQGDLTS